MNISEKLVTIAENQEKVFEAGKEKGEKTFMTSKDGQTRLVIEIYEGEKDICKEVRCDA